jgi:alpha-ketoglutarate-dependent taurine dioxygenase
MAGLTITPPTTSIGAEVSGVDLSRKLDAETRSVIATALGKPIVHPMVRTHAMHGSDALYFHIAKTKHIEGMTPDDSKAYLNDLLDRTIVPEIVYYRKWRKGEVLVIDDRATMCRAHGDCDRSQAPVLWRIISEGDRPVLTRTFGPRVRTAARDR